MTTVPPYKESIDYAFVCYAHEDADVVYPELARLEALNHRTWYDAGISPGHEWTQELSNAIDGCSSLLFFVTPRSVASRNCRNEVLYAINHGKPIVAVYLEPTVLPGGLELSIGSAQAIYKYELDEASYRIRISSALEGCRTNPVDTPLDSVRHNDSYRWWLVCLFVLAGVAGLVVWQSVQPPSPPPPPAAATASTLPAIAVLPFLNLSGDQEQDYFADSVAEEILNLLSSNPGLKVISRSSSFSFRGKNVRLPDVAQQLGVGYILQGSIRSSDKSVRLAVQLVDVATDTYRWNQTYDRQPQDIFAVQDEIAQDVASALNAEFLGGARRRQTVKPEAYTLYLEAYYLLSLGSTTQDFTAIEQKLTKALEIEPDYVAAIRELGRLRLQQMNAGLIAVKEAQQLRWDLISRALAIDPDDPISNAYRGYQEFSINDDLQAAARRFERATAMAPESEDVVRPLFLYLVTVDRYTMALPVAEYVVERNPLCGNCAENLASIYNLVGRFDDAARLYAKARVVSQQHDQISLGLGDVRFASGDYEQALDLARQLPPQNRHRLALEAKVLDKLGREAEFERALASLLELNNSLLIADVYASIGDGERAFEWLEKSLIQYPGLKGLRLIDSTAPGWEAYRDDPRWLNYLDAIGRSPARLSGIEFNPTLPLAVRQKLRAQSVEQRGSRG